MNDKELMQQALEALERCVATCFHAYAHEQVMSRPEHFVNQNIAALRERLAQPEIVMAEYKFQTYAAYKTDGSEMKIGVVPDDAPLTLNGVPLYPRREWVGLTDEEFIAAIDEGFNFALDHGNVSDRSVIRYARAIEAKLREKNT